jgi:hypothetical protein
MIIIIDSKNSYETSNGAYGRNDYNYNNNAPKTRMEKEIINNFEDVPNKSRKSKNETKNKKECIIF